ncbi:hypothetical protein BSKO_01270 [Bryopsis sp. KO-2023]|nr:hypothetical protein BSKO_01270 [Bryopsis sp. KO-2023]
MLTIARTILGRSLRGPLAGEAGVFRSFSADVKGSDTHDDFKPQIKEEEKDGGYEAVLATIKDDLINNDVFVFMKGTPDMPQCGFSQFACRVLDHYGVKYGSRNVLADPMMRQGIKDYSTWPTIPQVFVKGEFMGGADILKQMHENGDLKKLFEEFGLRN